MPKKMYSAFISSVYESLQDERNQVIDSLLDYRVFPICMEHFTVSTNGKFSEIEELVDASDFFILILGEKYGSCDTDGISWTEKEYNYALSQNKHILALVCDELSLLSQKDSADLTEDEQKQLAFMNKIPFARKVSQSLPIPKIIGQFFSRINFDTCLGWTREEAANLQGDKLEKWREEHKAFDLADTWYHVHLSADDESYIRTGTIQISQQFDPENYKKLSLDTYNYSVRYNAETGQMSENMLQRTHWYGDYTIDDNGTVFGIFQAKREFKGGLFGEQVVDKGVVRGIHDFYLDTFNNTRPEMFHGEFHDEAPSPKIGVIYVFRTKEARQEFLETNFRHVLLGC